MLNWTHKSFASKWKVLVLCCSLGSPVCRQETYSRLFIQRNEKICFSLSWFSAHHYGLWWLLLNLFHSLHSFYKPQVGKSIIQIYGQSERTVLIQLLKVKLTTQEMHPNKHINVCVGRRRRGRRIFNLMDYFACCYKSAAV